MKLDKAGHHPPWTDQPTPESFRVEAIHSKMINQQTAAHYVWGSQCDSWVLVDTPGLSVKQESMPGGTKEQLHAHAHAQQFFFILKGSATFYLDGNVVRLSEQQGLLVPPAAGHYIANETPGRLDFLVISQPTTKHDRILIAESQTGLPRLL